MINGNYDKLAIKIPVLSKSDLAQHVKEDSLCVIGVGPQQGEAALSLLTWSTDTHGSEAHPLFKNVRL